MGVRIILLFEAKILMKRAISALNLDCRAAASAENAQGCANMERIVRIAHFYWVVLFKRLFSNFFSSRMRV